MTFPVGGSKEPRTAKQMMHEVFRAWFRERGKIKATPKKEDAFKNPLFLKCLALHIGSASHKGSRNEPRDG